MDRTEFTHRVLAMQDRLYRVSCGVLWDEHDRADAVQEAVLKAWEHLDRLRDERIFETWLTRILINECYNLLRARRRTIPMERPPEPPPGDGSPTDGGNPRGNGNLRDALTALDENLRLVVVLHYMEGYRTREIARLLRLPEGTVKTRLRRAREQMRELLTEGGFEDE